MDTRFPPDVEVKKGYSWSEQLGIVIAALVEANRADLVKWTTEESLPIVFGAIPLKHISQILEFVVGQRSRLIEETDGKRDWEDDQNDHDDATLRKLPSAEAMAKITDYCEMPSFAVSDSLLLPRQ